MNSVTKFFLGLGVLTAVICTVLRPKSYVLPELKDVWWGEGEPKQQDTSIHPFKLQISEEILDDLHNRLRRANRMVPPLEGIGFQYGFNSKAMNKILDFWMNEYDWKAQENHINSFPHFKTNIQGLDVHFIHIKAKKTDKKVLPLILLHGWPGSFVEFLKIIPLLTKQQRGSDFVFEVVVPSLPGYGFSDPARKPGFGPAEMGHLFDNLMKRLGYSQYYVQGGDWGSIIGTHMATLYPQRIKGLHLTMTAVRSATANLGLLLGSLWPSMLLPADKTHLTYPLSEKFSFILRETGYMHLQATKPDTVGIALSDSPIGLAAYILEKFSTWTNRSRITDENGGLQDKFTLNELLDNVMVYWVTNSITTSMRLYNEAFGNMFKNDLDMIPCVVPTGVAAFPEELFILPEPLAKSKFTNLVSYRYMERGGHFAAFEEPALVAEDVFNFVKIVEAM